MRLSRTLILIGTFFVISTSSQGQTVQPWTKVLEAATAQDLFAGRSRPAAFAIFHLDEPAFRAKMTGVPSERNTSSSRSNFIVGFPAASGQLNQFRVVDAPVMDPALAARFPGINSYAGTSVADPSVHVRFDVTPEGIHAMIYSADEATVYIDPAGRREDAFYKVVSRKDLNDQHVFKCSTEGTVTSSPASAAKVGSADDGKLRTYRLALCASLSYSLFYLNGSETTDAQRKAKVLAAQVTQMTRANAILERDLAVRLVLIADNDKVIFVTSADNPFAGDPDLNETTQDVCDARIGNSKYDIGHLVNRDADNGNAGGIGTVCVTGLKGSGFTSYQALGQTEYFVVDYLTHEMGHQLGANHTFSFSYEDTPAQVEPGSGSTIMGYAGITNSNVQQHSDDYFNGISIQQITDYIQTGDGSSCAQVTSTGNVAPVVNAGANYTIPLSTPFTLNGSATDANGDALNYTWEQMTRANGSTPAFPTTTSTGSLFRSFKPTSSTSRTFPALESILDGTNTNTWERLPSVSRSFVFRLTARDSRAGGGANSSDDVTVQFNNQAGPFRVTTGNSETTMDELSTQTITWNVAGSNTGAVNCAQVRILLSKDGGLTFPSVLVAATANDGTEVVTIPAGVTTKARIKIEAVGNIFFDINNVNIEIKVPPCTPQINTQPSASTLCTGSNATFAVAASGTSLSYQWQVSTDGTSYTNAPGTSTTNSYTISNVQSAVNGNRYRVIVNGGCPPAVTSSAVLLTVVSPAAITAGGSPDAQIVCETTSGSFDVAATGSNIIYQWQVSVNNGSTFTDLADGGNYSGTGTATLTVNNIPLTLDGNLYRAGVYNATCNTPVYSAAASLTVNARPDVSLAAAPLQSLFPGQSTTLTATITPQSPGFNVSWLLNDAVISGETGSTYLADSVQVGDYRVRISNPVTGCTNQSEIVTVSTTASTRLFVYPNPNTGQFTVSYYNSVTGATRQTITIYNTTGLRVYNAVLPISGSYTLSTINLTGKATGVYYIVIGDQDGKKLSETKVLVR